MMKLITDEIRAMTPKFGETAEIENPLITAKFFDPCSHWTWYLIELDNDNDYAFGYVIGLENELGSFSIKELESLQRPFGLTIERDLHFKPITLNEIVKQHN